MFMFHSVCDFIMKRIDLFFKRQLSDKDVVTERLRALDLEWVNDEIEHGFVTGPLPLSDGRLMWLHLWFIPSTKEVILKYSIQRGVELPETEIINVSSWRARRFYLELKLEARTKQEWLVKERVSAFNKLIDSL